MSTSEQGSPARTSTTEGSTEVYKPKVSTWGVFPRPKDISKEFGGGRNLKPGQELETPEQKAAREAAYAAALRSYREKVCPFVLCPAVPSCVLGWPPGT